MDIKELQAKIKKLDGEADELEGKVAAEKDEASRAVIVKLYEAKVAELELAAKELEELKARTARKTRIAGLAEEDKPAVNSKKADLDTDAADEAGGAKIDLAKSEHNRLNDERQLDAAKWGYLTAPAKKATLFLSRLAAKSENLVDAMKVNRDGKELEGIALPSSMQRFIVGKIENWTPSGLREALYGKANETLLSIHASGTVTGGGSIVPNQYIPELYRLPQLQDRLIDLCMVKPAVGGIAYFPKLTQSTNRFGVTAYWGDARGSYGEGQRIGKSNPTLTRDSVTTEQLSMLADLSIKELRVNNVGIEAELMWMIRGAFDQKTNQAILQLSDVNAISFIGINTDAAIASGVIEVAREAAGAVSWADLVKLQFAINSGSMMNGAYVMRDGVTGAMCALAALDDTNNRPVLQGLLNANWSGNLDQAPRIAGRRCIVSPDNDSAVGARGDVIYGSWGDYMIALDQDITIDRSDEFAFNRGVVTFRLLAYLGGKPRGYSCFSVLGDLAGVSSSSASASSESVSASSAIDE